MVHTTIYITNINRTCLRIKYSIIQPINYYHHGSPQCSKAWILYYLNILELLWIIIVCHHLRACFDLALFDGGSEEFWSRVVCYLIKKPLIVWSYMSNFYSSCNLFLSVLSSFLRIQFYSIAESFQNYFWQIHTWSFKLLAFTAMPRSQGVSQCSATTKNLYLLWIIMRKTASPIPRTGAVFLLPRHKG